MMMRHNCFLIGHKKSNFRFWMINMALLISFLTACTQNPTVKIPGYVEGRYTYISSLFTGTINTLNVTPGMRVQVGQILFTLKPSPTNENLAIAKNKVQIVSNELNKTLVNFQLQKANNIRNAILLKKDIISKEEFDNGKLSFEQALDDKQANEARLLSVKADEKKLIWEMEQKKVTSPSNAVVYNTFNMEGENINPGEPVVSLLDPKQVKIIFFIPQDLLSHLKLNESVDVFYDASEEPIKAKISYISDKAEYTPPVIYSIEERQKLVFRIEATPDLKLVLSKIHPGQPVSIALDTKAVNAWSN